MSEKNDEITPQTNEAQKKQEVQYMYTTWCRIKENKIYRVRERSGDKPPAGDDWLKLPNDWGGSTGDDLSWYDKTMHRIPDVKLVEQGKRIDNRGRWFKKENPGETKLIYQFDELAGNEWTQETPLPNESYQKWNENKKCWTVDIERKEKAEKESTIMQKKGEIAEIEQKRMRSYLAEFDGVATKEDKERNLEYKQKIEILRAEINKLENV